MVVKLSFQDVNELKAKGYTSDQINKAMSEIEREDLQSKTGKSVDQIKTAPSVFSSQKMEDMGKYQLELNDILEQTEHILKGDIVVIKDKVKVWADNPHPENNPLNKEGVRKVMLELQSYINRHIILGDYEEDDINRIMRDYGKKFSNLIFMKYEEMGMDTEEKRQEYMSLVTNVVNLVYASYTRAKDGGERRSLREMISIQQSHQSQSAGMQMPIPQQKTRGILNPLRYVAGKYV